MTASRIFANATQLARTSLDLDEAWIVLSDDVRARLNGDLLDLGGPQAITELVSRLPGRDDEVLIVNDASQHHFPTSFPPSDFEVFPQFFIGVPLRGADGSRIGTFCGGAREPRVISQQQVAVMEDLAAMLSCHLALLDRSAGAKQRLNAVTSKILIYRDTFEQAAIGIAHTRFDGTIVRANNFLYGLLGYSPAELLGKSFVDITHPDDMEENLGYFMEMAAGRCDQYSMQKRFLMADGAYVWAMLSVALRRTAAGEPDYMIATIQDISKQKRVESDLKELHASLETQIELQTAQLRDRNRGMQEHVKRLLESQRKQAQAEQRLRTIADQVPAMIGYWDRGLVCIFANAAYEHWFAIPPRRVIGMTLPELMGEDLFKLNEPYVRAALDGNPQRFQRELTTADGSLSYVDARYIPDLDDNGEVQGFQVLVTDITPFQEMRNALDAANLRLGSEATTDELTGLANRRSFTGHSRLAFEAARDHGRAYGLILVDLDAFKGVNDSFGHQTGDDVLRIVGRVLRDELRDGGDIAARLGGDEFAILCFENTSPIRLCRLAERIRSKIKRETIVTASGARTFSGSFGVASSSALDSSFKDIYSRADRALYEAKADGKDRVAYRDTNDRAQPEIA